MDFTPRGCNFPLNHVAWPRYTSNVKQPGASILHHSLSPDHISVLFSQGQDMSLPGTKRKSGVDGGYPAESAVRCDKLMANLTRQLLDERPALAAEHINVARKLVSGIAQTMFTSPDFS